MVLAPIVIGYGLLVAWDARTVAFGARMGALAFGLAAGLVPFELLRHSAGAKAGPLGLTTSVIGHNWSLLWHECLPWALSYRVYYAHHVMDYAPWEAPVPVQALQLTGAFLAGAIVFAGLGAVREKTFPWPLRRLGFMGAMTWPVALGAFLVSVMVMDHFAMRYLAVLTLLLPFAALPAARMLGPSRFAAVLAPHLVASALCGWVGYGPFVRGAVPVREAPELRDDYTLFELLRSHSVRYAEADYWTSRSSPARRSSSCPRTRPRTATRRTGRRSRPRRSSRTSSTAVARARTSRRLRGCSSRRAVGADRGPSPSR